jgi:PKD repeat protein
VVQRVLKENREATMKMKAVGRRQMTIVGLLAVAFVSLGLAGCFYFGNIAPVASFTAVPASGPAPLAVAFDASGSTDVDGTIASYLWDFGDTQTDSGVLVSHSYTQTESKVYTVVLTVADDDGATDTAVKNISVTP